MKGVKSPLADPKNIDLMVVRENSEGEYSAIGGIIYQGEDEIAIQNAVFSRKASERVMRYACELAAERNQHVTSATKSNGIVYSMPFWDSISKKLLWTIRTDSVHIWTGKMMRDHLGQEKLGAELLQIIESVTEDGFLTPDIGGSSTAGEVKDEIIRRIRISGK